MSRRSVFLCGAVVCVAGCADSSDAERWEDPQALRAPVPPQPPRAKFATATAAQRANAAGVASEVMQLAMVAAIDMRYAAENGDCEKTIEKGAARTFNGPCKTERYRVDGVLGADNITLESSKGDDGFPVNNGKPRKLTFEKLHIRFQNFDDHFDARIDGTVDFGPDRDQTGAVVALVLTVEKNHQPGVNIAAHLELQCERTRAATDEDEPPHRCKTVPDKLSRAVVAGVGAFDVRGTTSLGDALRGAFEAPGSLELVGADTLTLDLAQASQRAGADPKAGADCFAASAEKKAIDPVCLSLGVLR